MNQPACPSGFARGENLGALRPRGTNDDGQINGRDGDSNRDLHTDTEQVYTVFRTNATAGAYGAAGVWVVAPESMANETAAAPDFSAASALYLTAGDVESGKGEPLPQMEGRVHRGPW